MSRETKMWKGTQNWRTPRALFEWLDGRYHFSLDAAADITNAKCSNYYTKDDDALVQDWARDLDYRGSVFVNPPFSLAAKFAKKCAEESAKGLTIVAIFHCATGAKWFREHVLDKASHVLLLSGRIAFEDPETGKPVSGNSRDSMICIWTPGRISKQTVFALLDLETFEVL